LVLKFDDDGQGEEEREKKTGKERLKKPKLHAVYRKRTFEGGEKKPEEREARVKWGKEEKRGNGTWGNGFQRLVYKRRSLGRK